MKIVSVIKKEHDEGEIEAAVVELNYNEWVGSGRCYIAEINPETKRIISLLNCESRRPRNSHSGTKIYHLPLINEATYFICESGDKSGHDIRTYKTVKDGKLKSL